MNVFKRKSIYAAVMAGLGAVGVAGTAGAVHINPDGLGQVLIYPYYTVRSATAGAATGQYNTYVSVTNTTSDYKAVKVRFLEGMNSNEVLDFNLFLSPNDVWTASVEPTTNGAMIVTTDKSCTTGVIPTAGQPFSNAAYSGGAADNETASLDRTREGYIELLEMGTIPAGAALPSALRAAVLHSSAGVPPCTASVLNAADAAFLVGYLAAPTGGLMGGASLVNPVTGSDYSYDAVALDNWSTIANPTESTSSLPTIGSGDVATSEMFYTAAGVSTIKVADWTATLPSANANAVSAAIMRDHVINEFVLDTNTASATDWVVTFPTKSLYVGLDTCGGGAVCTAINNIRDHAPALDPFNEQFGLGGSCDDVGLVATSREEQRSTTPGGFSPGVTLVPQLCWEANVISFNRSAVTPLTSGILGSVNVKNFDTSYTNGWLDLSFTQAFNMLTPASSSTNGGLDAPVQPTFGLPVVGFMAQNFINGNLNGVLSTYGGNFAHKGSRCVGAFANHAAAVAASACK